MKVIRNMSESILNLTFLSCIHIFERQGNLVTNYEEFPLLRYRAAFTVERQLTFRRNTASGFRIVEEARNQREMCSKQYEGGDVFPWNVCWPPPDYTTLRSRRHKLEQIQFWRSLLQFTSGCLLPCPFWNIRSGEHVKISASRKQWKVFGPKREKLA
jgi:hypothetical protein